MEITLGTTEIRNEQLIAEVLEIRDQEVPQVTNYWTCDACGGDSETGCMMSDPGNWVRY